jgi:hypothetical protein
MDELVGQKVLQGSEMHRNTEETACDLLSPRIGELDGP